ncbi:MAG: adenosine-specific kinase [Leptolyngbyaceae cyanobacterium]
MTSPQVDFALKTKRLECKAADKQTVEDLYEAITGTCQAKCGLAFSEASRPRLVHTAGNDKKLKKIANEIPFKDAFWGVVLG